MSKTDLAARPMFVRNPDAIETHLTIVFTALAVSREVQRRSWPAIRNAIRQLQTLRSASVTSHGATRTIPPQIDTQRHVIIDAPRPGNLRH